MDKQELTEPHRPCSLVMQQRKKSQSGKAGIHKSLSCNQQAHDIVHEEPYHQHRNNTHIQFT